MLFPTVTFAVFFLAVLPLSWLLMPRPRLWQPFMLTASFVFYAWWDWRFVFLLATSIAGNWLAGQGIASGRRPRLWLAGAVALDLGLLGYFKYAGFLVSSVENGLAALGIPASSSLLSVALPVGISFYTFMALSYVVDIHRGTLAPAPFLRFAVWLSFFPHLVAGPIVRGSELLPQLERPRDPRDVDVTRAFFLIVSGLFLKVVIANHLATHLVDDVFASPNSHSSLEVLAGVYGYAVEIFADFCGYTNIAIGIALLLGFRFPQNFDSPYAAVSLQDFWRRWHITLSRWLRDYLYIPLGGNRKGKLLTYRNLLLTMLLGGLWHGAAWTFVAWGGLHGAGLAVERLWRDLRRSEPRDTPWRRWLGRVVTFHVVCLGWIFFRAPSFGTARQVIVRLFDAWGQASPLVTSSVVLAIVAGIAIQYLPLGSVGALGRGFARLPLPAQAATLGICLALIQTLGPAGVAPFIYFRF
ncbi:MAG TPA: MBOAT family protein [Gaiellaceae bacterium]|nr:MBOAT family protein [Gaiellaceae bacterium]